MKPLTFFQTLAPMRVMLTDNGHLLLLAECLRGCAQVLAWGEDILNPN